MDPIIPQPGSARDPAHFVGRSRTTSIATNKLCNGNNLLLNDPRRMGKTYWLSYFVATTPHFAAILIDYEGVRSREAFLLRTVEALRQYQGVENKWGDALRAFFENFETTVGGGPVKVRVALQQQSPAKLLADTLAAVNEHSPKTVLICMDEVPLAILGIAKAEGAESARELLQTLRLLRQTLGQIRWILAGSVGFHHVLAACETTEGDLNDLDNLPLGPLTDLEADELARRLLLGIGREPDDGTVEMLVQRTGGFPYLLQKIASLLDDGNPAPVTPKEVVEAFEGVQSVRSYPHQTRTELRRGRRFGPADP